MKNRVLLIFLSLLLLTLACSLGATGTSETPASSNVLFQDDFSSKGNDWLQLRDADGITDYDQDGYRIMVEKTEWIFWSNPGINLDNLQIDVDATKIGGPEENEFGVICRYVDENNFYFFTITSDGYYSINKVVSGEYEFIGMDDFDTTDAVKSGNTLNHLTVECNGSSLKFWVNNILLSDVQDTTYTVGDVGLIAGTASIAGTDILFDNFVVTKP